MEIFGGLMLIAGGLFAGGGATFAWSRVPIRRRMPPAQFVPDFAATLHRIDKVQPALLVLAAASALGFAAAAEGAARVLAGLGAAGFVVTLALSLAIMVPLQRRIIAAAGGEAEAVEEMRLRWFQVNLGRSMLSVASFALVAVAATV